MPKMNFISRQVQLDPDDILIAFTDGVTEAKNPDGVMLEREGLVTLLRQHQDKQPRLRLQAVVDAIRPQQQLHDDITLLMICGD